MKKMIFILVLLVGSITSHASAADWFCMKANDTVYMSVDGNGVVWFFHENMGTWITVGVPVHIVTAPAPHPHEPIEVIGTEIPVPYCGGNQPIDPATGLPFPCKPSPCVTLPNGKKLCPQ